MGNSVVVYKSKYGSTKIYARWIAKELKCDIYDTKDIKVDTLLNYDNIIFGGGLYAGGINGIKIISSNFGRLKEKNIIIFTVGLSSTEDKSTFKPLIDKNLSKEMQELISIFHLRGGIDYKKLGLIHKPMMAMMKSMIAKKKPEELSEDDKIIMATYGKKVDFVNVSTATPIIKYIENIN